MGFYFQQILDEGTSNPIVARTHVQWGELIQLCELSKEKKEDLSGIFFDIMKAILAANKVALPLIQELEAIENDPKGHGLNLEPNKTAIPADLAPFFSPVLNRGSC